MSAPVSFPEISIAGITEPIIYRYFQRLNAGEFAETAGLFAEDGVLIAPFEEGVRGRQAIANYLHEEVPGLTAFPSQGSLETLEDQSTQITITGQVQTPLFKVNVRWQFQLTNSGEIAAVEVKLLASPQELINLRQFA
ncbi:hypothetical protein N0824_02245 [Microcystis sp. 0824]|uniref:nuclear transport factor 2 family protein n=1 Tax=Microcystis sp. 0824 TaxID=1502726 RepID=UPI000D0C6073|nr:nuclear transport factor 2 family protein [Microcystis sp. 0824]GBF54378.1 hypothetical protein N0824_02245 [Microcystis sp. 0824]